MRSCGTAHSCGCRNGAGAAGGVCCRASRSRSLPPDVASQDQGRHMLRPKHSLQKSSSRERTSPPRRHSHVRRVQVPPGRPQPGAATHRGEGSGANGITVRQRPSTAPRRKSLRCCPPGARHRRLLPTHTPSPPARPPRHPNGAPWRRRARVHWDQLANGTMHARVLSFSKILYKPSYALMCSSKASCQQVNGDAAKTTRLRSGHQYTTTHLRLMQ